jgi:hypothetical protein
LLLELTGVALFHTGHSAERVLRTLVQQNYKHNYAEAEKDSNQMHLYFQAVQLAAYLECSKHHIRIKIFFFRKNT